MNSLTQPLGLRRFLKTQPASGFDLLPYFDMVLIALIVALNSSRFVTAPGARVDLVRVNQSVNVNGLVAPSAVLTVDRNQLYFFGGQKIAAGVLQEKLINYVQASGDQKPILLIKADATISTESLFRLFELAKQSGFTGIHLAAEEEAHSAVERWSN